MFKGLTKEEKSWILFDWSSQSYVMIVMTTIMSLHFLHSADVAGIDGEVASAYWGIGNSIATFIAGVLAPILGTLSGYHGRKKLLFNFFNFVAIVSTIALAFVPEAYWWILLIIFVISSIGFAGGNKIYDAFLVDVAPDENMHRVSTLGFAMGYIGGAIAFILAIVLVVLAEFQVINIAVSMAYRLSFLVAAVWWIIFYIPMFKNVHQKYGVPAEAGYVRKSFVRVWETLKEVMNHKKVLLFLIAFFFYSDGVGSIIRLATAYGNTIGLDAMTLLMVLLVTQFVAFPFAIIYGRMAIKFGAKKTIYFGIGTYIVVCSIALFMNPERDIETLTIMFWSLAMLVGTAQGGIQALSRSYFSKIIPKEKSNEFFGIYNIFGRFASIIGTTLFGLVALATGQPHYGIAIIAVLFVLAAIIFRFVPDDRTFKAE